MNTAFVQQARSERPRPGRGIGKALVFGLVGLGGIAMVDGAYRKWTSSDGVSSVVVTEFPADNVRSIVLDEVTGQLAVLFVNGNLHLIDVDRMYDRRRVLTISNASCLAIDPVTNLLYVGTHDGWIHAWNQDGTREADRASVFLNDMVCDVDISVHTREAVAVDSEGQVVVWNVDDPSSTPQALDGFLAGRPLLFGGKGEQMLTVDHNGHLLRYFRKQGRTREIKAGVGKKIIECDFSADERVIAAIVQEGFDAKLEVYRRHNDTPLWSTAHPGGPNAVAKLSADGTLVAAAAVDRTIKIYAAEDGKVLAECTGHAMRVSRLVFSGDGDTLLSVGFDGSVREWEVSTGRLLRTWPVDAEGNPVPTVFRS